MNAEVYTNVVGDRTGPNQKTIVHIPETMANVVLKGKGVLAWHDGLHR